MAEFLGVEYKKNICFPPKNQIFNAFSYCAPEDIKVCILGQDPYHGLGQAHGLCFSVQNGVQPPPSLRNIFKELKNEYPDFVASSGCLEPWAKQGVLLINSVLTVVSGKPGSHSGKGWEAATDGIIGRLSKLNPNIVWLLWGGYARMRRGFIHQSLGILETSHPSPLSAYGGFLGCGHFIKTNQLLEKIGIKPIDWNI